jgi:hypothetical protein
MEPGTLRAIVSAVAFTARLLRASLFLVGREQPIPDSGSSPI